MLEQTRNHGIVKERAYGLVESIYMGDIRQLAELGTKVVKISLEGLFVC